MEALLQGDDDTNTAFRDVIPKPIDDDGLEIPLPSHEEVKIAIMRLRNNKAVGPDGLPDELYKTRCNELHQLIYKIWLEVCMPNDWNLNVLCPILRKGDPTI